MNFGIILFVDLILVINILLCIYIICITVCIIVLPTLFIQFRKKDSGLLRCVCYILRIWRIAFHRQYTYFSYTALGPAFTDHFIKKRWITVYEKITDREKIIVNLKKNREVSWRGNEGKLASMRSLCDIDGTG